ncbi:sulfotransferase domain-containing protein [Psychroserpens mesophilus]|uniref:sulfotransferase domain-containing protein n=1 Tax=Psychroserpens mesophilus TaxID=325473 RepID=UPI003D65978E
MKTNLFIAGACKSGTTYLHDFLSQQEDIFGSNPKEPYFFELPQELRDEASYQSKYFKGYNNQKYQLDSRHRTMFFSWIPKALYDYNSDAKLIFILRNPIDRAYSHWWMWYSRGVIKTSFTKSINNELKSIKKEGSFMDISSEAYYAFVQKKSYQSRMAYADAHTILESGYYYEQIKRFAKYFDSKNILILDFKQLSNKVELGIVLSRFLNVKISNFESDIKKNKAKNYKKKSSFLSAYIPKFIKLKLKEIFLRKPDITRKEYTMLKHHYEAHNEKLINAFKLNFVKQWQENE